MEFRWVNLDGVDFSAAYLEDVEFSYVSAEQIDFTEAVLVDVDFSAEDLTKLEEPTVAAEEPVVEWQRMRGSVKLTDAVFCQTTVDNVNVCGANLAEATFEDVDWDDMQLRDAEMSGIRMEEAEFPGENLSGHNLQDSLLRGADLSDANLSNTNLSGATLEGADLSNADLSESNLSEVDLRGAVLDGADLRNITLKDPEINQRTRFGVQLKAEKRASSPGEWDDIARSYHETKDSLSDNGLAAKARKQYILERDARGNEARESLTEELRRPLSEWKSKEIRRDGADYLSHLVSRYLTGYGVQVSRVFAVIVVVFVLSWLVYFFEGIESPLYYSVVTFVTAPPTEPSGGLASTVAMIEAFVGTFLIVLFGWVLGNRERF